MNRDNQKITQYFSRYSEAYLTSPRHARGQDLESLIEALQLAPESLALDAACGTGHTAVALARKGHRVWGLDLTPEMLEAAETLSQSHQASVTWVLGDVHQLPWPDNTFDAVACRRAAHHFTDLDLFLSEVHRVLKPGGRLGISDMTAPSDAIDGLNQLERFRDNSHFAARAANEWAQLVAAHRLDLITLFVNTEPMTPNEWLSPVAPTSVEGQQALQRLQDPSFPKSILVEGQFIKYRMILTAIKN